MGSWLCIGKAPIKIFKLLKNEHILVYQLETLEGKIEPQTWNIRKYYNMYLTLHL